MVPQLALGFAIVAGAARWLLPLTYSRLQVIAFVLAAVAVELVAKPLAGRRPSLAGFSLNAAAATLAVVAVKWWLEGISLAHWRRILAILLGPAG